MIINFDVITLLKWTMTLPFVRLSVLSLISPGRAISDISAWNSNPELMSISFDRLNQEVVGYTITSMDLMPELNSPWLLAHITEH
jgi:hypothetical protein